MLLVIDTASEACSVALVAGDAIVGEAHAIVARGHAERLLPMIAALPGGGRADGVLVDVGPGSFTGVRVGLAAARALGLGWGASVHGFSSLAVIAWEALARSGVTALTAAVPGGHGELFVQRFAAAPFRACSALKNLPPAAAAAFAEQDALAGPAAAALAAAGAPGRIVGDASAPAAIAAHLPAAFRSLPPAALYGRAPDAKLPA